MDRKRLGLCDGTRAPHPSEAIRNAAAGDGFNVPGRTAALLSVL
jgi:hypothetical protein